MEKGVVANPSEKRVRHKETRAENESHCPNRRCILLLCATRGFGLFFSKECVEDVRFLSKIAKIARLARTAIFGNLQDFLMTPNCNRRLGAGSQ